MGGTLDGIVTDIGITYVRFDTHGSVMSVPNSQVLNAIVGPIPPEPDEQEPPVVIDGKLGTPGGPEQPSRARPGPSSLAAYRHAEQGPAGKPAGPSSR